MSKANLLASIRGFKKDNLGQVETVDKSKPIGVVDTNPAPPPPRSSSSSSSSSSSRKAKKSSKKTSPPSAPSAAPVAVMVPSYSPGVEDNASGQGGNGSGDEPKSKKKRSKKKRRKTRTDRSRGGTSASLLDDAMQSRDGITPMDMGAAPSRSASVNRRGGGDDGHSYDYDPSLDVMGGSTAGGRASGVLLAWVFLLGALGSADLSIVLPSLWGYVDRMGGDYIQYGIIVAIYNLGQFCSAPVLGRFADTRPIKYVLLFSSITCTLGSALYFFAKDSLEMITIARLISGVGAGNVLISYAHITAVSRRGFERDRRLTLYSWMTRCMQVLSPAVGALGDHLIHEKVGKVTVTVNRYSFPALVMMVLFGLTSIALIIYCSCTRRQAALSHPESLLTDAAHLDDRGEFGLEAAAGQSVLLNSKTVILMLTYAAIMFANWSFLTAVFPYSREEFDWRLSWAYYFYLYMGAVVIISFSIYTYVKDRVEFYKLLGASLVFCALGNAFLLTFSGGHVAEWQIFFAGSLIVAAFCVAGVIIPNMYAAMVGVGIESLVYKMSWFYAITALASAIGPVAGATIIHYHSMPMVGLVGVCVCMGVLLVFLLWPPKDLEGGLLPTDSRGFKDYQRSLY